MTTSGKISGDFFRLLYILSHRQAANYFTRMGILVPSPQEYKQRRGTYFYYNRAAIGIACAQATAMGIDIAPHKRPREKPASATAAMCDNCCKALQKTLVCAMQDCHWRAYCSKDC